MNHFVLIISIVVVVVEVADDDHGMKLLQDVVGLARMLWTLGRTPLLVMWLVVHQREREKSTLNSAHLWTQCGSDMVSSFVS